MYKLTIPFLLTLLFITSCSTAHKSQDGYTLVWSDEFTKDGLPDANKWGYDAADGCPTNCGWGNNELQYYTTAVAKNARQEDGKLIIEAHKENMGNKAYTSARLTTKHKGDWKYGKIVVRAKLPSGVGVWPAIWMLPTEWKYGGWPSSGEIDIMENVGYMPDSLFCTVHTKAYNHIINTQVSKSVFDTTLSEKYHDYTLEWDADAMHFQCDGKNVLTFKNRHEGYEGWPFDQEFHLLINLAVGGNWGGKKGVDEKIWPQKLMVDYVRVYQKKQ